MRHLRRHVKRSCQARRSTAPPPRTADRRADASRCNTALYDGVLGALDAAGPAATTPASAGSSCSPTARTPPTPTSPTVVERRSSESGVNVDVVSLQQSDDDSQPARRDRRRRQGQRCSTAADPAALSAAFASEADALASQVLVTADAAASRPRSDSADVAVTVPAGAQTSPTARRTCRSQRRRHRGRAGRGAGATAGRGRPPRPIPRSVMLGGVGGHRARPARLIVGPRRCAEPEPAHEPDARPSRSRPTA